MQFYIWRYNGRFFCRNDWKCGNETCKTGFDAMEQGIRTNRRSCCMFSPVTTLSRVLARLELIPKNIVETMDFNAWAKQGEDFETLRDGTAWNKIVHWMADYDADHPYTPVRVYEAMKWEKTETCNWLRSNPLKFEFPEDIELKGKLQGKRDSSWSLPNIPKNVDLNSLVPKFMGVKK